MKRPLTASDRSKISTVSTLDYSEDTGRIAYVVSRADADSDTYQTQIWSHHGGNTRRLTSGNWDSAPRFNADGTLLAFLRSAPSDPAQAWILDLATGDETPLTRFTARVASVRWGTRELYVASGGVPGEPPNPDDPDSADEASRIRLITTLDYRFNGKGWTHDSPTQIYRCSASGGTPRLMTDGESAHGSFAINTNGSSLLAVGATDSDSDLTGRSHVWQIDTVSGERTCLTQPGSSWHAVSWTADGRPIGVGWPNDQITMTSVIALLSAGSDPEVLTDGDIAYYDISGSNSPPIAVDGGLLSTANRRGAVNIDLVPLDGGLAKTVVDGPLVVTYFCSNRSGSTVYASVTTPTRPAELWKFENGLGTVLVSLNDELLDGIALAPVETVQISSTDGVEVEAWITRPPAGVEPNGAGLVYVHGGPFSFYGYNFFDEFQLAAAEGYTVIGGNPRGSDGYGHDWGWCIVGNLGGPDWDDVQAITDHLAALPGVDEERIGIGGGSYGGFMTAWAVGHSNFYKAALMERGLYNWETFIGSSDIGTYFGERYLQASIETDIAEVRRRSPMIAAARIITPSLIIHSEEDFRCPMDQAEQLFAALRRIGTEVTFVRVPGENHELTRSGKPSHQIERFAIVHDFFNRHLT